VHDDDVTVLVERRHALELTVEVVDRVAGGAALIGGTGIAQIGGEAQQGQLGGVTAACFLRC
jgi:hypothetical protein